jgi:hypothetical protein
VVYTEKEFFDEFEECGFRGGHDPYIRLSSGNNFYFLRPDEHDFLITDIAHALSMINRYTGHTPFTYTVAQHSVLASHLVPPEDALDTLLHDASEAYLSDVSSPLKYLLPEYQKIEAKTERAIAKKFGLTYPMKKSVMLADKRMLTTEFADVIGIEPPAFCDEYPRAPFHIEQWSHEKSESMFFDRYAELSGAK